MRIQYKGGVWKNSEDEILKAAVMKYGKNQWARIASLLVRKSAKQCKARWLEWLDPSIKKTEWTREEEEKLLHLAKIMPTSWRTIAPMIGRTASQCLEHYEKLLDQAQRGTDGTGMGASSTGAASSRSRPGEIDPAPESRPARPDPVDMDEDELEMLSEARARLANTKGKKAKRKAREKQLEAAKRLAQLQKRRELKAAGIEMKPRRKNRKVTDYATEIPFERAPAPGFYDTREEDDKVLNQSKNSQIGKLLQKYKGKSEEEKEEEARKRDTEKRKELEKVNLPAALGLNKKPTAPLSPPLKKMRMSLPKPQVSDYDLEKIAKQGGLNAVGSQGESELVVGRENGRLGSASGKKAGISVSSVHPVVPWASVRQRQVEAIVGMNSAQTPLRGGPNTPVPDLGLNGMVTPLRADLRTPNPLATPFSTTNESNPTVKVSHLRRAERAQSKKLRETVKERLASLPEPENEYEIEVDESLFNGDETTVDGDEDDIVEDAEEEETRKKPVYEKQIEERQNRLLSEAAKRNLPLPKIDLGNPGSSDPVLYLVQKDIATHATLKKHLDSNQQQPAETLKSLISLSEEDSITEEELQKARGLIEAEMAKDKEKGLDIEKSIFEFLSGKI